MVLLISIVCFFKFFYYLIGEPLKNYQTDAPLSSYTYYMSRLVNKIKSTPTLKVDGLTDSIKYDIEWATANENLGLFKILFCGFCQSFWTLLIFSILLSKNPVQFFELFFISITFSLLIFKI